ncbi:Protein MIG-1 a [Aphelenchoides avenae]|nr:Protein MIG-1 a [Aphelenchus avenae]
MTTSLVIAVILLLLFVSVPYGTAQDPLVVQPPSRQPRCQRITAQQCAGIGYNETTFPNLAGDDSDRAAVEAIATFDPLISVKCSDHLKFFLCSVYFPMCTEKVPDPIGPCRPLCERVRSKCITVLKEFGFPWPESLECAKFPMSNSNGQMCMDGAQPDAGESSAGDEQSDVSRSEPDDTPPENVPDGEYTEELKKFVLPGAKCSLASMVFINRTAQCVPKCSSTHGYTAVGVHRIVSPLTSLPFQSDMSATKSALIIASILSVGLTFVCLVVACVPRQTPLSRRPIDRSLFYCTACFAFSASVYFFTLFHKENIACTSYAGHQLFIVPGMQHIPCTLVATVLYYLGTAGRLWWMLICVAWRWSLKPHPRAETEQYLFRAHVIAWATPLVLITVALMAQAVNGEPLSGLCLVGAGSRSQTQFFVSLRDLAILVACIMILASGCLTAVHSERSGSEGNYSIAGMIGALFPLSAAFWLIASVQHLFNPKVQQGWNLVSALKLLADPSLGILIGIAHFVYILHCCWERSGRQSKHGYQPGVLQNTSMHSHPPQQTFTLTTSADASGNSPAIGVSVPTSGPPPPPPPSQYYSTGARSVNTSSTYPPLPPPVPTMPRRDC